MWLACIPIFLNVRCQIIINTRLFVQQYLENGIQFCPRYFDGWSCINGTKAGERAVFDCPPSNQKACSSFVERKLQVFRIWRFAIRYYLCRSWTDIKTFFTFKIRPIALVEMMEPGGIRIIIIIIQIIIIVLVMKDVMVFTMVG